MLRVRVCGAVVCACAVVYAGAREVTAQQGKRRTRTTISVIGPDGKAWQGAKVQARSWRIPRLALVESDVVEAVSDKRGRVRLALLPSRNYSVWASQHVDGKHVVTALERDVRAGMRPTLRAWAPHSPTSVKLSAVSAAELGKRHSWALANVDEPRMRQALDVDEAGSVTLPVFPLPVELRLEDDKGRAHVRVRIDPAELPTAITIPRLPKLICQVVDFDKAPAANARVFQSHDGLWLPIGRGNDDGFAVCRPVFEYSLKDKRLKLPGKLRTQAPGKCDATRSTPSAPDAERDIAEALRGKQADIVFTCAEGHDVRGRVLWKPDDAAADLSMILRAPIASGKGSWSHVREPVQLKSKRQGRFVLRGFESRCGWRLFAIPSDADLDRLGRSEDFPWILPLWIHAGDRPIKPDLGELVIAEHTTILDVEVVRADGMPARYPRFALGERQRHPGGGIGVYSLRICHGTRRGRSRLMLPRGDTLRIGVGAGGACSVVDLDLAEHETSKIRITLPETKTLGGLVVDQRGDPVEGAAVLARISRAKGAGSVTGPASIAEDANFARQSLERLEAKSDAEGRFSFAVAIGTQLRISASYGKGAERRRTSTTNVTVDEEPLEELKLMLHGAPKKKPARRLDRRR